jgi:hypothetical protein
MFILGRSLVPSMNVESSVWPGHNRGEATLALPAIPWSERSASLHKRCSQFSPSPLHLHLR